MRGASSSWLEGTVSAACCLDNSFALLFTSKINICHCGLSDQCIKAEFTSQRSLVLELTALVSCDHRYRKRTCSVCAHSVANEQRSVQMTVDIP